MRKVSIGNSSPPRGGRGVCSRRGASSSKDIASPRHAHASGQPGGATAPGRGLDSRFRGNDERGQDRERAQHRPGPRPEPRPHETNAPRPPANAAEARSEEHTSELQSLMRISYAVFCLKKKNKQTTNKYSTHTRKS